VNGKPVKREPALHDLDDWWRKQDGCPAPPRGHIRRFVEIGLKVKMSRKPQSLLAGILGEPPVISTNTEPSPFDEEPAPPTPPNAPNNAEPAVEAAAVDPVADAESAVKRAQQAKSLLAGLDLDTAIRLRWVMRDIRANRTKLSPVSENDLATLTDLGFVEMREELPRLTGLGFLAVDEPLAG
jgi:hypothetical protein